MQTKITIRNEAHTCYIDIEGTIGVESQKGGSSVATYEDFRREVERITQVAAQNVVVNIRSTGGDVNDALLIYEALRGIDAHITTRCYGYTASAATIIAQAADEGAREISSNAMYLIHRSMCSIEGTSPSLEARAELLKKTDERLAQLYAQHSGGDAAYYAALMAENNGDGRWLTAEEAVEAGLADTIIDAAQVAQTDSQSAAEEASEQPINEELPSAMAENPQGKKGAPNLKKQLRRVVHTAVNELLRFLLSRFSYRWNEWVDKSQERQAERRAERRAKKEQQAQAAQPEQEQNESQQTSVPSATAIEVQDVAKVQPHHSLIMQQEGQRRYSASHLKEVEDPLMNPLVAGTNKQAYTDDAKAFSR
jgi:ATP-dependent protease ClpP protease subunit